ncbi:MAG: Ig domain-containing protein [Gemmatimonadota bacterium]|nr:MAG: Ig domain-containing protein [Gemmatimonadota bacterium]
MKRARWMFIAPLFTLAAMVLSACNGDDGPLPVSSVEVTPATATLAALGATQQFSAVAEDANGNTITGVTFTWASSNTNVATVDANGLATAVADGNTQITATTTDGPSGSADLTVAQQTATITVSPDPATLIGIGGTLQFNAEAFDANGFTLGTQPTVTWASGDDAVATVDAVGLATAQAKGAVQIWATADLVSGNSDLTVLGILHWSDFNVGTSAVPGALTLVGVTATDAVGDFDFVTLLQQGGWGLVVFGEQGGYPFSGAVQTELTTYVTGGGELLGTTWLTSPFAAFMEATATGFNYGALIPDGHPIFAGFAGPIALSNPGWGVYAVRYQPAGAGVCIGSTDAGDCAAILGNGGSTLLLGPLFDTYATLAEGEQLVAQSMQFLIDQATAAPTAGLTVGVQPRRAVEPTSPATGQRLQNVKKSGAQ